MKIKSFLPKNKVDNQQVETEKWSATSISAKLGIDNRNVAASDEYALDLAIGSARKLFSETEVECTDADFLLYCTQSPDYSVPTNACIIHKELGLKNSSGSIDINQGCSGYVYGLIIASSLVNSNLAKKVILITADTYSKYIRTKENPNRMIFGDAGTSSYITEEFSKNILSTDFGTDGTGFDSLIVRGSGLRSTPSEDTGFGSYGSEPGSNEAGELYMDGGKILNFTLNKVPQLVSNLTEKSGLTISDIDHYIFHQANGYVLNVLKEKCNLPDSKFHEYVSETGNTVSSSIPIVLEHLISKNTIKSGEIVMLVGFGVGLSWAGLVVKWP